MPKKYSFFLYLGAIFLSVVLLFPFVIMLLMSLKTTIQIFQTTFWTWPNPVAWQNYVQVWAKIPLARYFLNSVMIASGATFLVLLVGLPAAYGLGLVPSGIRNLFLVILLITQMFSPIVLIIAVYRLMATYHLLNTYTGLILLDGAFNLAFSVWLMHNFLATVPSELTEAALLDGASAIGALFYVLVPIARPGILTALIFTFINSWNDFVFAITLTSKTRVTPLTVGVYSFMGNYNTDWNYLMVASVISVLPVLFLFMWIQKHLVNGLTAGSIK